MLMLNQRSAGIAAMCVLRFSALALLLLSACCWADEQVRPLQVNQQPSNHIFSSHTQTPEGVMTFTLDSHSHKLQRYPV
ncbi:hypothetical protein LDENG_00060060 [Lucifuga dentata]|nr:hypothetical protein LDENG_00060060 [Lucifuga dentata]